MVNQLVLDRPIREICRVIDCEHKTAPYVDDSQYLVARTTNVRDGMLIYEDMKFTTEAGYNEWTARAVPEFGDVLFTREAPAGETCLIPEGVKLCMGQRMVLLRPIRSEIHPEYLSLYLNTSRCKYEIYRLSIGTTVSRINISDINRLGVLCPGLPEQTKIAQILSTWDRAIETTQKLIDNSKAQKKALMQQLLTGKKRLPGFDGEWAEVQLSQVADILVSNVDKKSNDSEVPVRLCNYTDVYYNGYITDELEFMVATATKTEIKKFTLYRGDVVITKDSETPDDIAVPALVTKDLNNVVCGYHLAIVRPDEGRADGAFLSFLFSLPEVRHYFFTLANGATRFGLSVGSIRKAVFHMPAKEEQVAVSAVLVSQDEQIMKLEGKKQAFLKEKKALMQQLLTGKRRVKVDKDDA